MEMPLWAHTHTHTHTHTSTHTGMWAGKPVFFAWMSESIFGDLSVGIGFVIAVGNLGGLCGPVIMGCTHKNTFT